MKNYRPISIILSISKIFEKCPKNRLSNYLKNYEIISDHQFGFKECLSTNDAITKKVGRIYDFVDRGKVALCIFLLAFDSIDRTQLLEVFTEVVVRGSHKSYSSMTSKIVGK